MPPPLKVEEITDDGEGTYQTSSDKELLSTLVLKVFNASFLNQLFIEYILESLS